MHAENGRSLESELGSDKARFFEADITSESAVQAALDAAVGAFGPLRAVVQCAGVANPCKVLGKNGAVHSLRQFEFVCAINLIGTFNVLRLAAAVMAKQEPLAGGERGCFVHVASVAAFEGQILDKRYAHSGAVGHWRQANGMCEADCAAAVAEPHRPTRRPKAPWCP